MNTFRSRIAKTLSRNSIGLSLFIGLAVLTVLGLGASKGGLPPLPAHGVKSGPEPVTLSGTLTQTKIVQNGDRTAFLEVVVEVASDELAAGPHPATDIVIVLDRSRSLAKMGRAQ
jgi:hypothetical protein